MTPHHPAPAYLDGPPGAGRAARRAVRRAARADRRAGRVSGRWWMWLPPAALAAVVAGALPSLSLFALAVGVVLTVVGAVSVVVLASFGLTVTRDVPVREVTENDPLVLEFAVRLPRWLPARLEVRTGPDAWTPLGARGGSVELDIGHRGAHLLGPSRLRLADPLGLLRRPVTAGAPVPVLVLPVPDHDPRAVPPHGLRSEEQEPDGLRPYVPGSPISRIHWASLARGGDLYERRLAPPPTGVPLVVVDASGASGTDTLDWLARAAAGRVLALVRTGGCDVLLPGAGAPVAVEDAASWRALHRRLALMDRGPAPVPPGRAASAVRVPPGLVPDRTRPPLPPGVVPLPPDQAAAFAATLGGVLREREPVR